MSQRSLSRLQLHNLHLAQARRTVLEHIEGDFKPGAITALIGANGAGKSTLIQAIMGELRPISGEVVCTVAKERRAWLPQQLALDLTFPMSVEELVMTGSWPSHGALTGYCAGHYRKGREIMARLGISHLAHRPLGELSGGQRQRALIGRTLMQEAELLLLDEPAAGLNPAETKDLNQLIVSLKEDYNVSVLLIEHDMSLVMDISDRITVINQGRPLASGTPDEIRQNDDVIKAYLGEA